MPKLYKVAIVGRVNVGKSTLFNKLISQPKAITSRVAGTTRDRNYAICSWNSLDFDLIDTGGLDDVKDQIDQDINDQIEVALKESDLVLFVVDSKTGILPTDRELLKIIKKHKKPIILIANKADNNRLRNQTAEFYKLNIGEPSIVSAANGVGTGDLLDRLVKTLKNLKKSSRGHVQTEDDKIIKVAIVGQPNVGKSSLINALLGEERVIVSPVPHTTRDSQDISISYHKQKITFIDTAGIRRRSRRAINPFEKQSVAQSMESIDRSDIALFMMDVNQKLTFQDKRLANELEEAGVGVIIIANKWDQVPEKDSDTAQKYHDYYFAHLKFLRWAKLLFTSTTDKTNLHKIIPMIIDVYKEKNRVIDENALDKLLKKLVKRHKPARGKGTKHPYIYSLKQVKTNPPIFVVKVDFKAIMHLSYINFIENSLRYKFGFEGVPIKIHQEKSQNMLDK
ncbi:ribosome biogenesis GTPase Der [bacterium]|jgi:GTPase|nr:ribosome biogenesis GTPase Der [bacterium]MBT4648796.1 ribosome biogenesis GTPase Der [bacterium]